MIQEEFTLKRVIRCVSNKKKSGEQFATKFNNLGIQRYSARYNESQNVVEIIDGKGRVGRVVTEIILNTQDVEVNRRKFRKATDEEIKDPKIQKYVVEKYTAHTDKQNTDVAIIKDVMNKIRRSR